jgi:hypothetical protein
MERDHGSTLSSLDNINGKEIKTQSLTKAQPRRQTAFKPFFTQDNYNSTASERCPVYRHIDFRKVFSIQPSEILTSSKPVLALNSLHLRSSHISCLACRCLLPWRILNLKFLLAALPNIPLILNPIYKQYMDVRLYHTQYNSVD